MSGSKFARGTKLVVASHNPGKVREIAELLSRYDVQVVGAKELGLAEPEETGATFADNARLKAEAAMKASDLPSLADDSGLCVVALDNAPGIRSARWAGPKKDFSAAMRRVEKELKEKNANDARAYFVCALALAAPDQPTEIFEGRVDGRLVFPPHGDRGFGYDPIFIADGEKLTFGEMEPARKHAISHRARAFAKFTAAAQLPVKAP
jgi:XTP/dITP diphosphohydrolase